MFSGIFRKEVMQAEKRIAVACFIGATLGALIAFQFNQYPWWLGILIGGLIGYLSYEFKTFIRALKRAWTEVSEKQSGEIGRGIIRELKAISRVAAFIMQILLLGFSWTVILWFLVLLPGTERSEMMLLVLTCLSLSAFTGIAVILSLLFLGPRDKYSIPPLQFGIYALKTANPITVLCYWIPRGALWILQQTPLIAVFTGRVAKRTFIMVHSELRLLCLTDAMLGAFIGYWCGNVLIGGVAGAVCGVLNYKLISVHWLKLVPR